MTNKDYTCQSSFEEDGRIFKACTDYNHRDGVGNFWCYINEKSWPGYKWYLCKDEPDCGENL